MKIPLNTVKKVNSIKLESRADDAFIYRMMQLSSWILFPRRGTLA